MRLIILSQFVVRPSGSEEFLQQLIETARERTRSPYTVSATPMRDPSAPWRFCLLEVFVNREAAAARSESDAHKRWAGATTDLVVQVTEEQLQVLSVDGHEIV